MERRFKMARRLNVLPFCTSLYEKPDGGVPFPCFVLMPMRTGGGKLWLPNHLLSVPCCGYEPPDAPPPLFVWTLRCSFLRERESDWFK